MFTMATIHRSLLTDALVLAAITAIGYLLFLNYQFGIENYYNIPAGFNALNPLGSLRQTLKIAAGVLVMYGAAEVLAYIIPDFKKPFMLRVKRIVAIETFGILMTLSISNPIKDANQKDFFILSGLVLLCLVISDFAIPYVRHKRYHQNMWTLSPSHYRNTISYLSTKSYLGLALLALVSLSLLFKVAESSGYGYAEQRTNYVVIDTQPKQIVLVDYGDYFLTARYDDSYPNKPAYHPEFKLLKKDDLGKDSFTYRYIPLIYHYPK